MLLHNILQSDDNRLLKELVEDQIYETWNGSWYEGIKTTCDRYGTDQNGRITIRVNQSCPWTEVASGAELENYIRNPPVSNQQPQQPSQLQSSSRNLRPRRNLK